MIQKSFQRFAQLASTFLIVLACVVSASAQQTGTVRGTVKDPTGAVVPGAKVTITDEKTNQSQTAQTTGEGDFQFSNLLPGEYTMTIEGPSFKTLTLNDVRVELNQTTDIPVQLTVGLAGETVEVSAGGTELVETTTTNLSKSFNERQVVELAQTSTGNATGINNLALIAPNVSSSGGVGVGAGGSVGGQRPRNNNFVVDGIDNNDKSITGPQIYVSPETVAEFSLLTNQFSAEYGHSTGGQFITVTKSGTNEFHGTVYEFFRNRKLNALDTLQKDAGVVRDLSAGDLANPRFDFNRFGGNVGGPILKNKLFFFTSYERSALGQAASTGGLTALTAAGLATVSALPGVSQTNLGIYRQFVPVAAANNAGTIEVCATQRSAVDGSCPNDNFLNVPIGSVAFPAPNFADQKNFVLNLDYTQSSSTQHRSRFIFNNISTIDIFASLPVFFTTVPTQGRLFSYTLVHNFTPNLINETRLAYRRFVQTFPVGDQTFPGLDQFPNILLEDLSVNIGPDPNAPQFTIENNYQVVDNMTWLIGNHSLKFGADFRKLISPQSFVQRQRGDYDYLSSDLFFRDIAPDDLGERTVGVSPYYGDQRLFFPFVQDDWRIRPNVTLNLGLSYSYQELPKGAKDQELNAISSVPGLLEFRRPRAQKSNFAPRVGLAWSPNYDSGYLGSLFGGAGKSSIRASFQMAHDVIFDNLYILSSPPQFSQTVDVLPNQAGIQQNFLRNGGIPPTPQAIGTDAAAARASTSAFIPDQQVPYSISWSLGFQRQFMKNWSIETRYLGSRGVHLLTQNRVNVQNKVFDGPGGFLPTFLSAPSQAQLNGLTTTLATIQARPNIIPRYSAAGFTNAVIGFLSNGNSSYHGGSAQLTRRFSEGFQMSAAYTWSHLIDDTTAEVFSTILSPRRVEDFQNLKAEKADSALDRRHRLVISSLYELPYFSKSNNWAARTFLGGISFSGTLTFESGEKATVRSGNDANQNGDSAGDRSIINPAGLDGTASTVTALRNSSGAIVAYLADNPNARYIQAGNGALSNGGRNTLQLPGINNLDFSVFKNFAVTETIRFQLGADFFNAFNHPQYTPGSVNTVDPISVTGQTQINTINPATGDFNVPSHVFSSHPRVVQIRARFRF